MKHRETENYLRTHRKRSGLSQREVGELLGYKDVGEVSRHERSMSIPPLTIALAYEVIFRVPVSAIFVGLHGSIKRDLENKLLQLETEFQDRDATNPAANLVAQKLVWLAERKSR
jgi:transcriptional regulator with XRE-family HTH domain